MYEFLTTQPVPFILSVISLIVSIAVAAIVAISNRW